MYAEVGDQLIGRGRGPSYGEILGVIVEVRGWGGAPPYLVRWCDSEEESLFHPDPESMWIRSKWQSRTRHAVAGAVGHPAAHRHDAPVGFPVDRTA